MNNKNKAFTLVEVIVIITVLAILITLSVVGINKYSIDTRDSNRQADITVISEALEKYYDKFGEYPACSSLQGATTSVYNGPLAIKTDALVVPTSNSTDTSSVVCSNLAVGSDAYAYIGADCDTGTSCVSWQLQYLNESSGTISTLDSRRVAVVPEPTPPAEEPPVGGGLVFTVQEATDICDEDVPPPPGYNVIYAPGGGATVYGTSGLDLIFGGSGLNIIYGGGGDDILCGNTGTDRVYGEGGHDYIIGGSGLDELYGGIGNDLLSGDSAADQIYGQDGDDLLYGGSGSDTLDGGNGTDRANDPSGGNYISIEDPF